MKHVIEILLLYVSCLPGTSGERAPLYDFLLRDQLNRKVLLQDCDRSKRLRPFICRPLKGRRCKTRRASRICSGAAMQAAAENNAIYQKASDAPHILMILNLYLLFMKKFLLVAKVRRMLPAGTMMILGMGMCFSTAFSQTVPVNQVGLDGDLRSLQLMGKLDLKYSFGARPFFTEKSLTTDSLYHLIGGAQTFSSTRKKVLTGTLELLPVSLTARFNSHHPYGWNVAGFQQASGLQTKVSAGLYFEKGFFSVQLKPEFVTAGNPEFQHNTSYGAASKGTYTHLFAGQSSARISQWGMSLGVSTESLWWGPGIYNSLLMSNNAPGFAHITFNTTTPVKTPIGSFEWQLIMGKLVEDPNVYFETSNLTTAYYNPATYDGSGNSGPYSAKENWRYLSGVTLSYSPKWLPGLFIGLQRVAYTYNDKLTQGGANFDFFHKYFPTLFGAFRESYAYGGADSNHAVGYKQIASVSARYVLPKSHAEVYAEFGAHDNAYNLRDLSLDPQHSAAYTIGFKKLKELANSKWLDITGELTRMSQQVDYLVRSSGDWYLYQGSYTHQNRIIGAGVGSGNNVQTLRVTHINGFNRVGGIIQALQHNPTGLTGSNFGVRDDKWNDLAFGVTGQYRYRRFLFSGECMLVHSKGYLWEKGNDRSNFYGLVNISYVW
jgi:hypothetical protein